MRTVKSLLAIAAMAALAAAPAAPTAELAKARETAKRVMAGTKALLEAELKDKGAAGALGSCSKVATDLARTHEQEGWRVRRVSDRLRNPAGAPDAWEKQQLARIAAEHRAKPIAADYETYEVRREKGRRVLRYLRPIVLPGEPCLRCHGDPAAFEPAVRDSLRRLYPRDRATGYRAGELRGAVSVAIPL